jgi:hypothetical protein
MEAIIKKLVTMGACKESITFLRSQESAEAAYNNASYVFLEWLCCRFNLDIKSERDEYVAKTKPYWDEYKTKIKSYKWYLWIQFHWDEYKAKVQPIEKEFLEQIRTKYPFQVMLDKFLTLP